MHIFISEYVCGGAWPDSEFPPSLLREARAMISSVVQDFSGFSEIKVSLTWDQRLEALELDRVENLDLTPVDSHTKEQNAFEALSSKAGYTLVIAPEFDQILEKRIQNLEARNITTLCGSFDSVRLCSDKLKLSKFLRENGIETPETTIASERINTSGFPIIVKPRFGAGSQSIQIVNSPEELSALADITQTEEFVAQKLISGRPLSVGVLKNLHSDFYEILPVAEQFLSPKDCFEYHGGKIPYQVDVKTKQLIEEMVSKIVQMIPGLKGYFGIDFLLTEQSEPVLIEINPRLTTSFYGYQKLSKSNLFERVLTKKPRMLPSLAWCKEPVTFSFEESDLLF